MMTLESFSLRFYKNYLRQSTTDLQSIFYLRFIIIKLKTEVAYWLLCGLRKIFFCLSKIPGENLATNFSVVNSKKQNKTKSYLHSTRVQFSSAPSCTCPNNRSYKSSRGSTLLASSRDTVLGHTSAVWALFPGAGSTRSPHLCTWKTRWNYYSEHSIGCFRKVV